VGGVSLRHGPADWRCRSVFGGFSEDQARFESGAAGPDRSGDLRSHGRSLRRAKYVGSLRSASFLRDMELLCPLGFKFGPDLMESLHWQKAWALERVLTAGPHELGHVLDVSRRGGGTSSTPSNQYIARFRKLSVIASPRSSSMAT
jgi:hypothetical protein